MKHLSKIALTLIAFSAFALQSFAPAMGSYKIGDTVANFSLKNVNGKMISLTDYRSQKGVIVVFTCNHCPFAKKYQDRINALNKKYESKGFPVVAISPNDPVAIPEDSYENMIVRAKEQKYSFPYMIDETQNVARVFGATKTPHAFVLLNQPGTGNFIMEYAGAIDDNADEPEKVQNKYVENAVNALLEGKQVAITETKSIGCGIKWKNQ
jgi:peroxiredoxin